MNDELFLVLGLTGLIAIAGGFGALVFRKTFDYRWFALALALIALDDALLTRFFFVLPNWPEALNWNWLGKVLSLAVMLAIAALPAFGYERCGLTLKQKPGWRLAVIVSLVLAALFFTLAFIDGEGPANAETIAFQWTMPGLDEEVFFRGVLLLAMNEAFRPKANILGAPIGYGGLLTCVVFGLAHALTYDHGAYGFDAMNFALTGGPSLILLWLRERTGSVLLPILAHNVANGAFAIV